MGITHGIDAAEGVVYLTAAGRNPLEGVASRRAYCFMLALTCWRATKGKRP